MVKNWIKFYESDTQVITEEMCCEVMFFRWHTRHDNWIDPDLVEKFGWKLDEVLPEFAQSEPEVTTSTMAYQLYKLLSTPLSKIDYEKRIEIAQLKEDVINFHSYVDKKMEGFPKFYELEDILLEYVDIGYKLDYIFSCSGWFATTISNQKSTLKQYLFVFSKIENIINNIQRTTSKRIFLEGSEFSFIDIDKYDFSITIKIS